MSVRPAKTQISLGIRPAVQSLRCAVWTDAQADLCLRWAPTHFVGFVMSRLLSVPEDLHKCWSNRHHLLSDGRLVLLCISGKEIRAISEPAHEIMTFFVLRKLILQTRIRSHPVEARCLIFCQTLRLFPYFMCANSEGSGETARIVSPESSLVAYVVSTIIS